MVNYLSIIFLLIVFVFVLFLIKYSYFLKMLFSNQKHRRQLAKLKDKKNKKASEQKNNANILLKYLGNKNNIKDVKLYSMRLKVIVKDRNLVNKEELQRNSLLSGVIINGNICQLIVGQDAKSIYKFLVSED